MCSVWASVGLWQGWERGQGGLGVRGTGSVLRGAAACGPAAFGRARPGDEPGQRRSRGGSRGAGAFASRGAALLLCRRPCPAALPAPPLLLPRRGRGPGGPGLSGAGRGVGAAPARGRAGGARRSRPEPGPERGSARLLCGSRRALQPRPAPARQGTMAPGLGPWLLALALAAGPAGLWAQLRLVEDGGGLRAPGETVRLSCRGSGFSFGLYAVWWYRQAAGGSLEWVSYISWQSGTRKDYGAGVQGRATASRDNSRSESILSLRDLQPRDSARYFCAVAEGGDYGYSKLTFGSGTRLSVQPNVTPSPSVYRLISKDDEDLEMCLITDYSPEKLKSKADKQTTALVDVATPENNQEVSYLSTYWAKKDEMECGANHEGVGELKGEDPESGASTVCVTEVSLNFRTDENLNMLSLSHLGLKVILMKAIIFNVLMTMLMWKKKNASN
ncbi:M1-specific T cell receptor alpha chain-like [Haliaeetus albicilla]|uniref:M1-specific T cell receptor alpha chain-like n=1 Tax=Haliaeetus albicilla TaxID=8969 RepID=UPI0037E83477